MLAVGFAITVVLAAAAAAQTRFRSEGRPSSTRVSPETRTGADRSLSPPTSVPSSPPTTPTPKASTPSPRDSPSPSARATPRRTPLYELLTGVDADGPSGERRAATLQGRTSTHSMSFWVGCREAPAVITFDLRRAYTRLSTVLMFTSQTPAALQIRIILRGDGAVLQRRVVTPQTITPVDLRVTGVRTLALEANAISGRCGTASVGYGIAYDAAVQ